MWRREPVPEDFILIPAAFGGANSPFDQQNNSGPKELRAKHYQPLSSHSLWKEGIEKGSQEKATASEAAVGAAATAVASETAAITEREKQPHMLERKWTFWFDNQSKPKQGAAWGTSLREVYTFGTVEEFWCLYDQIFKPSKVPGNADFHLFKVGTEPKWEDPECANGGKWSVPSNRKANLDIMWLETLMALIGEQFEEVDDICGVVASARQRQDKLALWTKTATNEALQMSIGRKWKEIIDVNDKMTYSFHDDSRRDRGVKSRYSV